MRQQLLQALHLTSILLTTISLIQNVNAAFDGMPLRPGKTKFDNDTGSYDSSSILSGLLSRSQLLGLDLRQQSTCQPGYPIPCSGGVYCCTQTYNKCCGDGTCCPGNANCRGSGRCCPQIAQTCGGRFCCNPDATCCGNPPRGCCDAGLVCCPNTCCRPGESCCGDLCCAAGTKCCPGTCCPDGTECAGNGQCRYAITSTSTSTSTNSTMFASTTLSTSTRTITSSSTKNAATSSAATPTMSFVYVPGLTDAICANICLGMRKRNKTNVDLLTYDPTNKRSKRAKAGCVTGYCNTAQSGRTCDEYPFASSGQGGTGASIACVPKEQNTDQGTYMKFWFLAHGYLPGVNNGKTFGVEVVGIDCNSVLSVGPRHDKRATITGAGDNSTVLPGSTFDNQTTGPSSGRLLLPLGDVNAGAYSMSISVPNQGASIDSLLVVDNEGEQFFQANGPVNGAQTVNFRLLDDGIGIGMVVFTSQSSLSVSWDYSATSNASSVVRLPQFRMALASIFLKLILHIT